MAITQNQFSGQIVSGTASGAVTVGRFGKITTTAAGKTLIALSGNTERCDGIITVTAADGAATGLAINGTGYLNVNGTTDIAAGDDLGALANGIGAKVTSNNALAGAYAYEPYTANDANGEILVQIQRHQVGA